MAKWKRYVVGPNALGKSQILSDTPTMEKSEPGVFYRIDQWCTAEMPVNNAIDTDRALDSVNREPVPNGIVFRSVEIFPDSKDTADHAAKVAKLHQAVGQTHMPTAEDYARHPSMHRTDTLDCIACVKGEVYLMTDVDEVLMKPGDVTVIRGVNHAWSNRSSEPALLIGVLVDARPEPRS